MQASNLPTKVPLPFASSGTKNAIPLASQIGITPGAASLTDGFPPLTFTPLASGGVPPAGADFNGILNLITGVQQWQSAGGIFKYDSAFSASVGGYPKGAVLESSDGSTLWLCLADNNTTDPDGATPANWAPASAYGIGAVTGLTNANVTLTPAQFGKRVITLAGTLTGNVQIILPAILRQWLIVNNTTGSFTATVKTASGTGIAVTQGASTLVRGDGTNIVQDLASLAGLASQVFSVATATASAHATPLSEFAALLATNGYIKIPCIVAGVKRTFILQFIVATVPAGTTPTITLPIPFPNAGLVAVPGSMTTGMIAGNTPAFAAAFPDAAHVSLQNCYNSSAINVAVLMVGW